MFDGHISIRDRGGNEKHYIDRKQPIWSLSWNPSPDRRDDIIAVGCWDRTLSFYTVTGQKIGKDKQLDGFPLCVRYHPYGDYLVVSTSDHKVHLWTKDGVKLNEVCELDSWVWSVDTHFNQNLVVSGSNRGNIAVNQIVFSTVHGLYQDRYAYRDEMTDVIVQNLINDHKVRIQCKDYVKKIAVYRSRIAVQLSDKVIIYQLANDENSDMNYKPLSRFKGKLDCNLLVVTSEHLILCLEKKLQLFNFEGIKQREWVLESVIRYIKVIGGPPNEEGLLVGLKNGSVLKIYVNNPFPISLIQQSTSIRCLDLSANRQKLAVIDENNDCLVYDLNTKELLFQEKNANSVAWNSDYENMLCFSGDGVLSIKTDNFPLHQQKMLGFVVGFKGSKIFCLHFISMQTIDVPQSASLYRYLEANNFEMAYKIACLGVTDSDWKLLAMTALKKMELKTARMAFIRLHDVRFLDLLNRFETDMKTGNADQVLFEAEVLAYQGRFHDAAKLLCKANHVDKAIQMFSDLRKWDEARKFASKFKDNSGSDVTELVKHQAEWAEEVGDWKASAEMHTAAGNYQKAVELLGSHNCMSELIEVARQIPKSNRELLMVCANYFETNHNDDFAFEIYSKLADINMMMKIHIKKQEWDQAFILANENEGQFSQEVFLPYAKWLVENDRFDEAQAAYIKAGKPEESIRMLEALTQCAILEHRYKDSGYYFFLLSEEYRKGITSNDFKKDTNSKESYDNWKKYRQLADLYYAYQFIHRYIEDPFTTCSSDNLLNVTRFLINEIQDSQPFGTSRVNILHTMAKLGTELKAYKLARYAYDKLTLLKIPKVWQSKVELGLLTIQSKPFVDDEDLLPICYRCNTTNTLINMNGKVGDLCSNCGHPFYRSFVSFDLIPLVEFVPEPDITDEEACRLIDIDPEQSGGGNNNNGYGANTLNLEDEDNDKFTQLLSSVDNEAGISSYAPLPVNREILESLKPNEVFIVKWNTPGLKNQYFKNMISDVPIVLCSKCNHFFHEESYEFAYLQSGSCPYCRTKEGANSD